MNRKQTGHTGIGHLAGFAAYAIFGFNIIFCKDIANGGVLPPIALFTFRALGAGLLFWLLSLFLPKEKVAAKDFPAILGASLLGLFVPQMTFLTAIGRTSPMDLSVINTITPIMTMFFAAIFLHEPITFKKAGGVIVSFTGVIFLIFQSIHINNTGAQTSPSGVLLVILNSLSFALYLGIFRPLISRYRVVTFMKWMFLFSFLISLPFSAHSIASIEYRDIPTQILWEVGYLILFATFFAYFLIPLSQKHLRPTLISMYGYLQPIIATSISIATGMDKLSWQKICAALMVFAGVAIVNQSRAAQPADISPTVEES